MRLISHECRLVVPHPGQEVEQVAGPADLHGAPELLQGSVTRDGQVLGPEQLQQGLHPGRPVQVDVEVDLLTSNVMCFNSRIYSTVLCTYSTYPVYNYCTVM